MTEHQKVVACGCGAVFGGIDFLVGTINAYTQNPYQNSATIRHFVDRRLGKIRKMNAVRFTWQHGNRFHEHTFFRKSADSAVKRITLRSFTASETPDCCKSFAISPVQPVWWLAPTPEPSSPWKYS